MFQLKFSKNFNQYCELIPEIFKPPSLNNNNKNIKSKPILENQTYRVSLAVGFRLNLLRSG